MKIFIICSSLLLASLSFSQEKKELDTQIYKTINELKDLI
jgi:hypothetical protein